MIAAVICAAAALYTLWLLFLAVMALKLAWRHLSIPARMLAAPAVLTAVLLDILVNWTLGCLIFVDLPREATLSKRCGRLKRSGTRWQQMLARWICSHLLDPFEQGGHCR